MRERATGMSRRLGIVVPEVQANSPVQIQKTIFCLMTQSLMPALTRSRMRASTVGLVM